MTYARMQSPTGAGTPAVGPKVCPACGSTDLTTASKTIDESSYWRCGRCGEVWNAARREAGSRPHRRW